MAGFFNAVAFLALTKSLQLVPVVYVNALNATQATMAAVAGVLLFAERSSPALWFGVALTVVGLLLMQRGNRLSQPAALSNAVSSVWSGRRCRSGASRLRDDEASLAAGGGRLA